MDDPAALAKHYMEDVKRLQETLGQRGSVPKAVYREAVAQATLAFRRLHSAAAELRGEGTLRSAP